MLFPNVHHGSTNETTARKANMYPTEIICLNAVTASVFICIHNFKFYHNVNCRELTVNYS